MASLSSGEPGMGGSGQCDCGMDEQPPVGTNTMGPVSPGHGAAGGTHVNWDAVAPTTFTPTEGETGMTTMHPAMGG